MRKLAAVDADRQKNLLPVLAVVVVLLTVEAANVCVRQQAVGFLVAGAERKEQMIICARVT